MKKNPEVKGFGVLCSNRLAIKELTKLVPSDIRLPNFKNDISIYRVNKVSVLPGQKARWACGFRSK